MGLNSDIAEMEMPPAICGVCGQEISLPWGTWGMDVKNMPAPTHERMEQVLEPLEHANLCWRCVLHNVQLERYFFQAKGDLQEVAKLILSEGAS